jgi:hypothetical protein
MSALISGKVLYKGKSIFPRHMKIDDSEVWANGAIIDQFQRLDAVLCNDHLPAPRMVRQGAPDQINFCRAIGGCSNESGRG